MRIAQLVLGGIVSILLLAVDVQAQTILYSQNFESAAGKVVRVIS